VAEDRHSYQRAGGAQAAGGQFAQVLLPAVIDLANAAQVAAKLAEAGRQGCPVIVADMTATLFCDCAGVAVLLMASRAAAACGSELRVAAATRAVLRLFELTGALAALRVASSVADALAAPPPGPAAPQPARERKAGRQVFWFSRHGTDAAGSAPRPGL
jgi:anti-anti-sigma factor